MTSELSSKRNGFLTFLLFAGVIAFDIYLWKATLPSPTAGQPSQLAAEKAGQSSKSKPGQMALNEDDDNKPLPPRKPYYGNLWDDVTNQLRLVYITTLPEYTDYPAKSQPRNKTIVVAISEHTPFQSLLPSNNQKEGHNFTYKFVMWKPGDAVDGIHVAYCSERDRKEIATFLKAFADKPVLTVGEAPDFITAGGMIEFSIVANNLRYSMSKDAMAKAGLKPTAEMVATAWEVVKADGK